MLLTNWLRRFRERGWCEKARQRSGSGRRRGVLPSTLETVHAYIELLEDRTLLSADLLPYVPSGWSDSIVLSTQAGTHTDDAPILASDTLRVDVAWINDGQDAAGSFQVQVDLDSGTTKAVNSGGLSSGYIQSVSDFDFGTLSAGPHTITMTIDALDAVTENNESNNVYSRDFVVGDFDFGDAPTSPQSLFASSYPTLLSDNGARHAVIAGFSIGSAVDGELNGQPNMAANLDDTSGTADEDGVTFSELSAGQAASVDVVITNTAGVTSPYLDAWIDFNRDGDWNDAGENVFSGTVTAGTETINFTVPAGAGTGNTYARFRLHDGTTALGVDGAVSSGEVEDHSVVIIPAAGVWQSQGPAPTQDGQVENVVPNDQVTGAIHTVLAHPSNPDILYIGSVNGGIWKTTNATATNPTWTPQTDFLGSLSIGAMAFDPTDATNNTLVAGTARYSSFGGVGGARGPIYRTTDGGDTWTELGSSGLKTIGENISGIAARGSTIVVTSSTYYGGIFRSTDTGATFTAIDDEDFNSPNDNFTDLVVDPSDATGQRLYAAAEGTGGPGGVYRSDDFGATWTKITGPSIDATMDDLLTASNNIEMAVHPTTGRLFVAVLVNSQPEGIFYSDNAATGSPTWTQVDVPVLPLGTGTAITGATNTSPIVITSAGHGLSTGNFVVVNGVTGNTAANGFFRITKIDSDTFSLDGSAGNGAYTGSGTWTKVTGPNPSPKTIDEAGAQGRIHFSIVVDPTDEDILYVGGDRQDHPNSIGDESYGGAIFRGDASIARDPTVAPSPQWDHITHDQVATDPAGGTASGSAPHADSREMVFDANGNLIEVDDGGIFKRTSPQNNTGDWYSLAGTLGVVEFHDIAYDSVSHIIIGGTQDNGTHYQLTEGSNVWKLLSGGDGGDVAVDSVSLAGSGQSVRYSSSQNLGGFTRRTFDAGNNLVSSASVPLTLVGGGTPIVTGSGGNVQFTTPITLNTIDPTRMIIGGSSNLWESDDMGDTVSHISSSIGVNRPGAVAYGGTQSGVDNTDVLYVGSGSDVYVRTSGTGSPTQSAAYSGGTVKDIVLDPANWASAFVIDADSVFSTSDAGGAWMDITGNLMSLAGSALNTIEYISGAVGALVVGGDLGVFTALISDLSASTAWTEVGANLPNALVYDMDYDANDDVLVAGTLGRGVWTLPNASEVLGGSTTTPTVNSVSSSTTDGSYKAGDVIAVTVTFSENVTVTGSPQLELETGATDRTAHYSSGSGSDTLTFDYIVQAGDTSLDLDYTGPNALTLNGGTITGGAGNNATLTLPSPGAADSLGANKNLVIDTTAPAITNVSIPNSAMKVGDTVTVTITVADDGGDTYTNLSGTIGGFALGSLSRTNSTTYTAQFTVTEGGTDVAAGSDIPVNVTLDDSVGNTSSSYTTAISQGSDPLDANSPTVASVTPNLTTIADANAGNQTFTLTVVYSENMDTGSTPTITFPTALEDPANTITLDPASGWSNATTYVARYDVADVSEEIDDIDVRVTGATDVAGNIQTQADHADEFSIDTLTPTVTSVTPNLGTIAEANTGNQTFTLTVVYDNNMDTGSTPTITFPTALEDPSNTITLDPASGWSNATTYVARYDVVDVNVEVDDIDVRVTGATDVAGNIQTQADHADEFSIDTTAPTIQSITSTTADGAYGVGANINVTVTFSESVTLSGGTLDVTLDTTDVVAIAAFSDSTTGARTYTVGAGDNSSDLDSTGLTLSGATLRDAAGNDATVVLPATTIADGSAIVIDTTAPAVTNNGLTVNEGSTANVIGQAELESTDARPAASLTYTLDFAPTNGTLYLDTNGNNAPDGASEILAATETFTQADIDANRLKYDHNGSDTTSDSFQFDVGDSIGNSTDDQTFNITVTPAQGEVTLVGGVLTFTDEEGGDSADNLTISYSGGNYTISDTALVIDASSVSNSSGNGTTSVVIPGAGVTSIVFDTLGGDDTLTIDFSGDNPVPAGGLTFQGGAGGNDSLFLTNAGTAFDRHTYTYTNSTDGRVELSNGTTSTINFEGLDPLSNDGTPTHIIFNLPGTADPNVALSDQGGGMARLTTTTPTFEQTDFAYPVAGGSITINMGANDQTLTVSSLALNGNTDLTINGQDGNDAINLNVAAGLSITDALSLTAETIAQTGPVSVAGTTTLAAGTGTITLNHANNDFQADVTVSSGNNATLRDAGAMQFAGVSVAGVLTVNAGGAVTQTGAVTGLGLELLGTGPYTLTNAANDFATIAANTTEAISYLDATALVVGTVTGTGTVGITTSSDDVRLETGTTLGINAAVTLTGGDLTIDAGGAVTQTAGISGSGLELLGTGPCTLTNAGNDFVTIAANTTEAISYFDANALAVGTVTGDGTVGITTSSDDVRLETGTTLGINAAVSLTGGDLTIDAGSAVTQTAAISGSGLELLGTGPYTLTNAGNDFATIAANSTEAISYLDATALVVGTVTGTGTAGITTSSDDVRLETGTTLGINAAVSLTGGDLTIDAGGAVTQTAAISGSGLELLGTGPYTLTNAGNDFVTIAANTTEAISYLDATTLAVGTVAGDGTVGITTSDDNVTLQTGNAVTIDDDVSLGTGDLTLNVATGGATQNANDDIAAGGLQLLGAGAFTFTNAGNDVTTVAVDVNPGSVSLTDANDIQVGTIGSTSGIATGNGGDGGDVTINATSGRITVDQAITTAPGSGGNVDIDGDVVVNAGLTAEGGTITLNAQPTGDVTIDSYISATTINIDAARDIIVNGVVMTTDAGADINLSADGDGDGDGGVLIRTTGQLVSAGDVTVEGSDLFDTSVYAGSVSVGIQDDGTNDQIQAAGTITIRNTSKAPATADVIVDGRVTSTGGGTIDIQAEHDVTFGVNGDLTSNGGNVTVTADDAAGNNSGGITMADGAEINSGAGTIGLNADGNIALGRLVTTNDTAAAVTIDSTSGAVTDAGDTGGVDIEATGASAGVTINAATGVGTSVNPIETTINNLEGYGGTGGFFLVNSTDLTIGGVDVLNDGVLAVSGDIDITAYGALTASENVGTADNVTLTAVDAAGCLQHVIVHSGVVVASATKDVNLQAGDIVDLQECSTVSAPLGTVTLLSDYGNADVGLGSAVNMYGTVASLNPIIVEGNSDNDTFNVDPGLTLLGLPHTVSAARLDGLDGDDTYNITFGRLAGLITIEESGSGTDTATFTGLATDETYNVENRVNNGIDPQTGGTVESVTESETVQYSANLESFTVNGLEGEDTFNVQPSQTAEITINGGTPSFGAGVPPATGDTLNFDPFGNSFTVSGVTLFANGGSPDDFLGVTFVDIENIPISPLGSDTKLFDFNHDHTGSSHIDSPTQAGFTGVQADDVYDAAVGYGWLATGPADCSGNPIQSFDRTETFVSNKRDLLRDGHVSTTAQTFQTDLANGYYLIGIHLGHAFSDLDQLRVRDVDSDQVLLDGLSTEAGESGTWTVVVNVTDGTLDLEFSDLGGERLLWGVNGIEIRPAEIFTMGGPPLGPLDADGVTVDTPTAYNGTPNAFYTITTTLGTILTADANPDIDGIQIQADGSGEFQYQIQRPTGGGMAIVLFTEVNGASTGSQLIEYTVPSSRRFDFNHDHDYANPGSSPTQTNHIGVLPTDTYTAERGFGWSDTVESFDDLTNGDLLGNLRRDGHWDTVAREFRVDLPTSTTGGGGLCGGGTSTTGDTYLVTVTLAEHWDFDAIQIKAEGNVVASDIGNEAHTHDGDPSTAVQITFTVTVNDGALNLEFTDLGGDTPWWVLNGLEILSTSSAGTITFNSGPGADVAADGATVDTINATSSLTAGTLVTVSTTLGAITTADADTNISGTQVVVGAGGAISFDVRRPAISGTPTFTAITVDGETYVTNTDSALVSYGLGSVRRFDFNHDHTASSHIDSPTQAGFIGVQADNLYTAATGYGWQTAADSFDRALHGAAYPVISTDLYRDGHYAADTAPRTFCVEVDSTKTYDLRIYVGDRASDRDGIKLEAEDGKSVVAPATDAGAFTSVTLLGVTDATPDGILELTLSGIGAYPGWVLLGLDIAEAGGLPGAVSLNVVGGEGDGVGLPTLTQEHLAPIVTQAIAAWESNVKLTESQSAALRAVTFDILDLGNQGRLGLAEAQRILIDDDGAGYGWFVDATSAENEEFDAAGLALADSAAAGHVDLLTAVTHELGHILGLPDEPSDGNGSHIMSDALPIGTRRLPTGVDVGDPDGTSHTVETVGLYNSLDSVFYLQNSHTGGIADVYYGYGPAGANWTPVSGDWDGDGIATLGLFNSTESVFYLKNSHSGGVADVIFAYGPAGANWIPVSGDWDGDGDDTLALYNPSESVFYLKNSHTGGVADVLCGYGPAGANWLPVSGDWDGDGLDTLGLYNPVTSQFFLRNIHSGGAADVVFAYGPAYANWEPIAGDWDGDGLDTLGLYNPLTSEFFLKNSLSGGVADVVFAFGPAGANWTPVVGDWTGSSALHLSTPSLSSVVSESSTPKTSLAPIVETAIVETAIVETAIVETAIVETAIVETAIVETAIVETAIVETAIVETAIASWTNVVVSASRAGRILPDMNVFGQGWQTRDGNAKSGFENHELAIDSSRSELFGDLPTVAAHDAAYVLGLGHSVDGNVRTGLLPDGVSRLSGLGEIDAAFASGWDDFLLQ